jgi:hypothetical protein
MKSQQSKTACYLIYRIAAVISVAMSAAHALCQNQPAVQPTNEHYPVFEAFPEQVQAAIENQARGFRKLPTTIDNQSTEYVINITKKWLPGQTVRVAFLGGDAQVRRDIAEAGADWSQIANVKFDFGPAASSGMFREWTVGDQVYAAEVRISFNQNGYWSYVGTDSVNPNLALPGQASMNLQEFDKDLPQDWRGVALHEFGHALGFEHEHASPLVGCDEEFRWNDDPGYVQTRDEYGQFIPSSGKRPGLYTVLAGPPNLWPKAKVDFNLRQLTDNPANYITSQFDATSVMKYYFPAWMFVNGEKSRCFSSGENMDLSALDKAGLLKTYPVSHEEANQVKSEQVKGMQHLSQQPGQTTTQFQEQMKQVRK